MGHRQEDRECQEGAPCGASGIAQISVRLQFTQEEKRLPTAVHAVSAKDTEVVRAAVTDTPCFGVVHLCNDKVLVRCKKEHLGSSRTKLSPSHVRYFTSPNVEAKYRYTLSFLSLLFLFSLLV